MKMIARICLLLAIALNIAPAVAQRAQISPSTSAQPYVIKPQGSREELYSVSAALVISEANYLGGASGWPPLTQTTTEMDAVRDVLVSQGFEVTRVYDPKSQELISAMQLFLSKYAERRDARLLFFYSGHGYTSDVDQMSYIVPIDAGNPIQAYPSFIGKAITLEYFHTWVRQFKAMHFLTVFDSCFSGAIFTTKSLLDQPKPHPLGLDDRWRYLTELKSKPVRQFISAGGPMEKLPAQSTFVPVFIEGLRGGASAVNDGYVTGKELGLFLERVVSIQRAGRQNPVSGVSRDANFIFGDMIFQYDTSKAGSNIATRSIAGIERSEPTTSVEAKLPVQGADPPPETISDECRIFDCQKK